MSRVPDGKLEPIAAQLGAEGVDWAIDRLQRYSLAVRHHTKAPDDKWDRLALEGALNLQIWLALETKAHLALDEECPVEIDDVGTPLAELLPLIASYIRQPGKRGGPTVDGRRHVCAAVCASIWQEFHPTAGSNSDTNWKWFLPTSNSPEKSEVG